MSNVPSNTTISEELLPHVVTRLYKEITGLNDRINHLHDLLSSMSAKFPATTMMSGSERKYYDHSQLPLFSLSLRMGTIVHSIPHYQYYQVKLDGPNAYIFATPLREGSSYPGAATYTTYAPNTRVIVATHDALPYGLILGSVPLALDALSYFPRDMAAIGCSVPFDCQPYAQRSQYTNWCGRTPYDSSVINEHGYAAETGMTLHLDPFYAALKLNPTTGVFLSYWDNLLRLAGRYTQEWKAGVSKDYYFDFQCANNVGGFVSYFRELTGCLNPVDPTRHLDPDDYRDKPWLTSIEPVQEEEQDEESDRKLIPFYRVIDYSGFLGAGHKKYVCTYPADHGDFFTAPLDKHPIGLAEAGISFDGTIGFRSATGIYLSKHPIIVPPIMVKNPADPSVEHEHIEEGGPADTTHSLTLRISGRPELEGITGVHFPMAVVDYGLVHFIYESVRGIAALKEDFAYPSEDDYDTGGVVGPPISIGYPYGCFGGRLSVVPGHTDQFVKIDHKWQKRVFSGSSYVSCLPDGSIAISDGYGSEIRMGGGKIFLSAPYGLFLQSGREIVSFAGGNIIQTANEGVEITAKKSASIAAYSDLWLEGGLEEGSGRVNIESRSRNSEAGILISAPFSAMRASAEKINLHAFGKTGEQTDDKHPGLIILESTDRKGNPNGIIAQYGSFVVHDVGCAVIHRCNAKDPPSMAETKKGVDGVYAFTSLAARLGAPVFVTDSIAAKGPIRSLREIGQSSDSNQIISCFDYINNIFEWSNKVCTDSQNLSTETYDSRIKINWKKPIFTFGSIYDYKTMCLEYPESRWERDSRLLGSGLADWDPRFALPTYDDEGEQTDYHTYSYPGRDIQNEAGDELANSDLYQVPKYVKVEYSFFDPRTGKAKADSFDIQFNRSFTWKLGYIPD